MRSAAERCGGAVAISSPEENLTFSELDATVTGMAGKILLCGLGGERVGIYSEKSAARIALIFALIRSGSVAAPISTRIPPDEAPEMLFRAGCSSLVSDFPEALRAARDKGLETFIPEKLTGPENAAPGPDPPEIPLARPATVVFTSGSTGAPRAALHTFGNHYANAVGSSKNIPLAPGDIWLHSLPLFHVGGLSILFRCVRAGATIALPGPDETPGEALRKSGATHVSLVATQLLRSLEAGEDLSGARAILLGGSAVPSGLLDRAFGAGLSVHTSYGLTEMASQVTTTRPGADRAELATSGRVLPHRELRISGGGEILVRGETLFAGYAGRDGTASPLDPDGWFHTKDLGYLDESGLLTVTGRLDNLFISGGENIQPEEVEEELRRLAGVVDAVVVPVADREFGERPVAFVKAKALRSDLDERLRRKLPGFKVPAAFFDWPDDAPQGMKLDRAFFRRRAAELR